MWNRGALKELREDVAGVIAHAQDVLAKIDEAITGEDSPTGAATSSPAAPVEAEGSSGASGSPVAQPDAPPAPYEGHTPLTDEQQAELDAAAAEPPAPAEPAPAEEPAEAPPYTGHTPLTDEQQAAIEAEH